MNSVSSRLAAQELGRLRVEVVELALEDRDDVPGDVLEDLGVLERAAAALDGRGLHCARAPSSGAEPSNIQIADRDLSL